MAKKFKYLIVLIALSISLGIISNTYSRYVSAAEGNVDMMFANWQILVNTEDITNNVSSSMSFTPVIESNENVKENVMAPSSTGYFDIEIDPTNVGVSFNYLINLSINNEEIPDLVMTKYAILEENYIEGDVINPTTIEANTISNTLTYDKTIPEYKHKPFTIRVFFEWVEGLNESMDDEADTNQANKTFDLNANISFTQKLN